MLRGWQEKRERQERLESKFKNNETIIANRNIKKGHILDREDIEVYSINIKPYGLIKYFEEYIDRVRYEEEVESIYRDYFITDKDKLNEILNNNMYGRHSIDSDVDKEYLIEEINKLLLTVTTGKNPFYNSEHDSIVDSVVEELFIVLKIKSFLGLRAVTDISNEEELKLTLLEDPELQVNWKNKIKLQIENNLWL